ncbi:hypothetical protein J120_04885 [candidate division TM6 bacterium JCVI TM6SC1]|uniref:Thioredoxin domain-containing protein n=1 Tax=candidate division TM6 bacterium JCVI TM6SC1 TaxID=1306947 RepID=A0A0D2JD67_9BACT|nr:hypothetical protein J120_04885 [candidate division TM6 bacterium JCVI TM6SC1]
MKNKLVFLYSLVCLGTYSLSTYAVIRSASSKNYKSAISSGNVIVKFFSPTCGACQKMQRPYQDLSQDPQLDHVKFVEVNIDTDPQFARSISTIPTFRLYKEGQKVKEAIGITPISTLKSMMIGTFGPADYSQGINIESLAHMSHIDTSSDKIILEDMELTSSPSDLSDVEKPFERAEDQGILKMIGARIMEIITALMTAVKNLFTWIGNTISSLFK